MRPQQTQFVRRWAVPSVLIACCIIGTGSPLFADTDWDGSTDTDWFDATNWSAGVPDANDNVTIPNSLSNYPVLTADASCNSLTVESTASLDIGSNVLEISGSLDVQGSTALSGNSDGELKFIAQGNINVDGPFVFSGDFRLVKDHNSQNFVRFRDDVTIDDLIVDDGRAELSYVGNTTITVSGNMTIASGQEVNRQSATLSISGNVTITGTFTNDNATGSTSVAGNWTDSGTHDIGAQTVTFNGGGTSTVSVPDSSDFYNLTIINNTTVNVTSAIDINGTVTIGSGSAFDCDGDLDVTGGAVTCSGTGRLQLGSSVTSLGTFSAGSGTVEYDDTTTNRTIQNVTYHHLEIDAGARTVTTAASETLGGDLTVTGGTFAIGANTVAVTGATDINGTVTVSTGVLDANGSFDATGGSMTFTGAGRLQLGGAVTSLGTFTESTSTVEYDNTAAGQTVDADTYYNLEVDTSTRVALTGGNVTVTNDLTVTSGELEVDDLDVLQVDNDVSVSGTLDLEPGAHLELAASSVCTVNSGGTFEALGSFDDLAVITSSDEVTPGRYTFSIAAGGILRARFSYFRFMDANGIQITDNGAVTALTQLERTMFDNGASGGRLLKVTNNDNAVNLDALQFFDTDSNLTYNVETVSATATITIDRYDDDSNSTGFGGPDNENDNGSGTVNPGFILWSATTPVRLVDFSANRVTGGVLLEWESAAEWRLAGFALERASGGAGFQPIGPPLLTAQATAPSGASYRFLDDRARPGILHTYRLIEIGRGGATSVLATESVPVSPTVPFSPGSAALLSRLPIGSGVVRLSTSNRTRPASSIAPLATPILPAPILVASSALSLTSAGGTAPVPDLVKIWVEERGITRVSSNLLASAGFDPTSNPTRWRLTRDGIEIPIRTFEDGASTGMPRSGLDFLADPIEHPETRGDVYWLDLAPAGGPLPLRLPTEPGGTGTTARTPRPESSFTELAHEEDLIYVPSLEGRGRDHWFWSTLVAPGLVEVPFLLDHVVVNSVGASLEVWLEAWSQDPLVPLDHAVVVRVNGVEVTTIEKNGSGPIGGTFPIPPSALREGTNQVEIEAVDLGGSSILFLDRFTIRYRRAHHARGNRVEFSVDGPGTHRVAGFDRAEIVLYRTSGGQGPAFIEVGTPLPFTLAPAGVPVARPRYDLVFETRGSSPGDLPRFEAFTAAGARAPVTVEPVTTSPILSPPTPIDLILITPSRFATDLDPLISLRRSQGWTVQVVEFEAIANEFGRGRPTSDAIRAFLEEAWTQWPTPAPRAVLLVGDATYDPRGNLGVSPFEVLPTRLIETRDFQTGSDAFFADLEGNDGIAELAVGRLPVSTVDECRAMVEKIIEHETVSWSVPGTSIFVRDDDTYFVGLNAEIATRLPAGGPNTFIEIGTQPIVDLRTLLEQEWQGGAEIVHYTGHGSRQLWADEAFLAVPDVTTLQGARLPLVTAMNCLNGYFVHLQTPSLGEALVLEPAAGAIAYWGPTAITSHLGQHQLALEFHDALSAAPGTTIGEAILAAQQALVANPQHLAGSWREHLETWVLLGDPMLRVR